MLRQDNPVEGRVAPPRSLPLGYVLVWKVSRARRTVRRLRQKHDGIGWVLVSCVIAVVVGSLIGHF